jgi:hypothetical protein
MIRGYGMKGTPRTCWIGLPAWLLLALSGCTTAPLSSAGQDRPMSFHDTRLQYALLTNDGASLKQDFKMTADNSPVERAVAGLVLPFAAATEAAFWPLGETMKAFAGLKP